MPKNAAGPSGETCGFSFMAKTILLKIPDEAAFVRRGWAFRALGIFVVASQ
jgi:hypothetical protein